MDKNDASENDDNRKTFGSLETFVRHDGCEKNENNNKSRVPGKLDTNDASKNDNENTSRVLDRFDKNGLI